MTLGVAIFDYLYGAGFRNVAILNEAEGYGTGLLQVFSNTAQAKSDFKIVSQQTAPLNVAYTTASWATYMQNIKSAEGFVILLFGVATNLNAVLDGAEAAGMWNSKYAWYGSEAMYTPETNKPGFFAFFPSGSHKIG